MSVSRSKKLVSEWLIFESLVTVRRRRKKDFRYTCRCPCPAFFVTKIASQRETLESDKKNRTLLHLELQPWRTPTISFLSSCPWQGHILPLSFRERGVPRQRLVSPSKPRSFDKWPRGKDSTTTVKRAALILPTKKRPVQLPSYKRLIFAGLLITMNHLVAGRGYELPFTSNTITNWKIVN